MPWLLLGDSDMQHVGTLDVDMSLDAEALGDMRDIAATTVDDIVQVPATFLVQPETIFAAAKTRHSWR